MLLFPRAYISQASKIGLIGGVTYVVKYFFLSSKRRKKVDNGYHTNIVNIGPTLTLYYR